MVILPNDISMITPTLPHLLARQQNVSGEAIAASFNSLDNLLQYIALLPRVSVHF
jgi:hypothetical protein